MRLVPCEPVAVVMGKKDKVRDINFRHHASELMNRRCWADGYSGRHLPAGSPAFALAVNGGGADAEHFGGSWDAAATGSDGIFNGVAFDLP